jgi:Rieske Fe-S protein
MNPVGTKLGKPGDYAAHGLHILPGKSVLIGRDAGGLYALTSICTHKQCNLDSTGLGAIITTGGQSVGIQCACHGSRFDNTGAVTHGPATKPLQAFALSLGCDAYLYVDTGTVVPSTTRLLA